MTPDFVFGAEPLAGVRFDLAELRDDEAGVGLTRPGVGSRHLGEGQPEERGRGFADIAGGAKEVFAAADRPEGDVVYVRGSIEGNVSGCVELVPRAVVAEGEEQQALLPECRLGRVLGPNDAPGLVVRATDRLAHRHVRPTPVAFGERSDDHHMIQHYLGFDAQHFVGTRRARRAEDDHGDDEEKTPGVEIWIHHAPALAARC